MTTEYVLIHPSSPSFLKKQVGVSAEKCAWVALKSIEAELPDLQGIPINNESDVAARLALAHHKVKEVVLSELDPSELHYDPKFRQIACFACSSCTQTIIIRGPEGAQVSAMNRGPCTIWQGLPEYPAES